MSKIDLGAYLETLSEPEDRAVIADRQYQRDLFEQYVTKGDNFPARRAQLLRDHQAGRELTGPRGLRRALGAIDLEYFGRAYLAQYFVRDSPPFHAELDAIWREGVMKGLDPSDAAQRINRADGCRRAIQAPRGHAKSTTFTFKDDLHAALYAYKHYIIILSDSSEQADGFLADLKTELEENATIREDFGNLEGKVWKASVILLSNGVKIEALGAGKKIRGRRHKQWRPDLIVCDDLENDENVNTPEQRRKLRSWFYKAVSKAGDTYTDIVYIGTLLHYDALLANVANNPSYKSVKYQGVISFAEDAALWATWEAIYTDLANDARQEDARAFYEENRAGMLKGTAVLWEEKLSYYDLMVIRISEGEASFNSEIQNDPIDPENCTFQEEWFDYYDDDGKTIPDFSEPRFIIVGANAPSLGKNKRADTSSLIFLAKDTASGYMYVIIADIDKRKPDRIIEDALESSRRIKRDYKKPLYKFGVETVQFQYYFAEIMRQRAAEVGEYLPIEEINSVQHKDARIQSLQPFVKNGYIKFSKKHKALLQQMMEYPMGKNDDGPDGLQMAVKLALDIKVSRAVDYKSVLSRALGFGRGAY
ncbi:MAG: phage terminase large subunit [Oscillospiraceae bacterium]|nr:phage terminase large subunit [Oscillospiraceae bacterium]